MADVVDIRVMSYNVRSLRDDADGVADLIRACEPDVACIQEAPRFLMWRSKMTKLAEYSRLVVITGGRPAAAMLLLGSMRTDVKYLENVLLTKTRWLHQRGLAIAVLEVGGARFAVASLHLSLKDEERTRHLDEIAEHIGRLGEDNVVLAGDINETPDGRRWAALAGAYQDAHIAAPWGGTDTFPASAPVKRIDGIFVSSGIEVVRCGVPEDVPGIDRVSDHRPVVADLRITRSTPP